MKGREKVRRYEYKEIGRWEDNKVRSKERLYKERKRQGKRIIR